MRGRGWDELPLQPQRYGLAGMDVLAQADDVQQIDLAVAVGIRGKWGGERDLVGNNLL